MRLQNLDIRRVPAQFLCNAELNVTLGDVLAEGGDLRGAAVEDGETSMPGASYVDPRNGATYPLDVPRWCSEGRSPLLVTPSAGIAQDIDTRTRSLLRYQAALPVRIDKPITLGEGCTPLVEQAWGYLRPHFKLEWFNPTGRFKDRARS